MPSTLSPRTPLESKRTAPLFREGYDTCHKRHAGGDADGVTHPMLAANRTSSAAGIRNVRMMQLTERIARAFNQADIPLLILKGAALHLTLYKRPDDRPMDDIDLMVQPDRIEDACHVLEELGALRGEPLLREDFFPRYHYETEYVLGDVYPVKIDLHVRPFRPLRHARLIPADAFWRRAECIRIGQATVLVPSPEHMLIHLAAHVAFHGMARDTWLLDIALWIRSRRTRIDWDKFLEDVTDWHLALPVRRGLTAAEDKFDRPCPAIVHDRLAEMELSWRDKLALAQAPRDAQHPAAHVAVNVLCTPGWRFVLGYLLAVFVPDRGHMGDWYPHRHRGWLPIAHLLRWFGPLVAPIAPLRNRFSRIEVHESKIHGIGVFARRTFGPNQMIARCRGKAVEHDGLYVGWTVTTNGRKQRYEITGRLKYLNHSCRPNAELSGYQLVALRSIRAGHEITIRYDGCTCRCDGNTGPTDRLPAAEIARVA